MKVRIIPTEHLTIAFAKRDEEVLTSLKTVLGHRNGSKTTFESASNGFVIQRTLHNSGQTVLTAKGVIIKQDSKKLIRLDITASDSSLVFFVMFWYIVNFLLFLFLIYILISTGSFNLYFFLPLF